MSGWELLVSTRIAADVAVALFVKGSAVVALAAAAAHVLRRRPAAVRHWIWVAALMAVAALPVLEVLGPRGVASTASVWHYPAETALVGLESVELGQHSPSVTPAAVPPTQAENGRFPLSSRDLPVATAFLLLWWVGVLIGATRLFADLARAALVRARCEPVPATHPASVLLQNEVRRIELDRRVELRFSEEEGLAATLGVLRPAIVVGHDVAALPKAELRPVLLHELAHIQRRDFLLNVLARGALAISWINPTTVWLSRMVARDREQACDDAVISNGVTAPHYARVLLAFAASPPALSPAMRSSIRLRFSSTKLRLDAILDVGTNRSHSGRPWGAAILAAFAAAALTLASVDLLSAAPGTGTTPELVSALAHEAPEVRARAARTLGRRDPAPARIGLERLLDDPEADVRLAAVGALEQLGDPASLSALARVLERPFDGGRGEHGYVLKLAMRAVGAIDSPEAADVLEKQLDRPVAPLRWLALQTMLSMPSQAQRAWPYVEDFATSDTSDRNRRLASELLRER